MVNVRGSRRITTGAAVRVTGRKVVVLQSQDIVADSVITEQRSRREVLRRSAQFLLYQYR